MTNRITVPVPGVILGLTLLLSLLAAVVLAPAASAAGKVPANLRVVTWKGKILYDGKIQTGSARIKPKSDCLGGGAGPARTVAGPTALGLLWQAARKSQNTKQATKKSAGLRPLAISDGDFGFGICGIGGNNSTGEEWWALRNNQKDTTTGAELTTLKRNDSVLLYLSKSYMEPTPDALFLKAPAKVKKGKFARVRVFAYNGAGKRRPAEGVGIVGTTVHTNAKGYARFRVKRRIRTAARLPGFIPSNRAVIKVRR